MLGKMPKGKKMPKMPMGYMKGGKVKKGCK
jgi:hypothetical protein